ncbi:MAG: DUF1801 domain-containing protein [Rhodobacterales bacterium]|jgi:uncharacterized protein YdeI (YjbR/CyaY-like superfamily)|nr:DUF1801 domain-containing protein [Pseudomonadota bacterium]MDA1285996.1 DUF1801 domain-containing protein [Pseudomonadota bacterium]
MCNRNPKVDAYLNSDARWQGELSALRAIILECPLTEEGKWNKPCYTFQHSNLIAFSRLKDCCWLMFFKGALLADCAGILAKAGENSQSMRVIPFTSVGQINGMKPVLKAYIQEAIDVEKAGLKVDFKRNFDLVFPQELLDRFDENPDLKAAFDALAPGRQRGYNLYFFGAKQSKTKQSRIAKSMPRILAGKGLTDR